MTKRRRKKLYKIMHTVYTYIRKGKFDYLYRQNKLFEKHARYLAKMQKHSFYQFFKRECMKDIMLNEE